MPTKTKSELEAELRILRKIQEEYEGFKQEVRDKAIEVADEQGWCKTGLNITLEELGLAKLATAWKRTALIRVVYKHENEDDEINFVELHTSNWESMEVLEFEVVTIEETEELYEDD